jgi:hypothetical protein
LVTLEKSSTYNPAITLMVSCAIAYADAITAKRKSVVNTQDHASAPRLLREVLGNNLPDRQEKFYRRLLGRKDEVNYGARSTSLDEAKRLLSELDDFAEWAESALWPDNAGDTWAPGSAAPQRRGKSSTLTLA